MNDKINDIQNSKQVREKNVRIAISAIRNLQKEELLFLMIAILQKFNKSQLMFAVEDAIKTMEKKK